MAKSLFIDGVFTTIHFNSSVQSFQMLFDARYNISPGTDSECCYCHRPVVIKQMPPAQGLSCVCPSCKKDVIYLTMQLGEAACQFLNMYVAVGPLKQSVLVPGSVMHIVLPPKHPEFDQMMNFLQAPHIRSFTEATSQELFSHFATTSIDIAFYNLEKYITPKLPVPTPCHDKKLKAAGQIFEAIVNMYGTLLSPHIFRYTDEAASQLPILANKAGDELFDYLITVFSDEKKVYEKCARLLEICYQYMSDHWYKPLIAIIPGQAEGCEDKTKSPISDRKSIFNFLFHR